MDLPKKSIILGIMVVLDHIFEYAHLCALKHPFMAYIITQVFMDNVLKLHGMPTLIVIDHDCTFTSNVLYELFRLLGTQLNINVAYHPQQTDKQK